MLQRTDSLGVPVSIVSMRTAVAEVPSYLEARDIQVPQQAPARREYVGLRDLLRLVTDNVLFLILATVAMVRQGTTGGSPDSGSGRNGVRAGTRPATANRTRSEWEENLERARRIERPTLTLARLCSTPELRPLPWPDRQVPMGARLIA